MKPEECSGGDQLLVDILQDRRTTSDILWASRKWVPASAYRITDALPPQQMKSMVLQSYRVYKILKKIHKEQQIPLSKLDETVIKILNEIGYNRMKSMLRWLAFFVAKALKRLLEAVYVNEGKFLEIKSKMGSNPLLFVPSHKSYFDFVLMSYICFHYEVDIPRIAAGMDFQSMTLIGNVLRDACAFFMRRTFANDELYSAVFSQYIHTLVTYGDASIEFFIEGTRSRTQKSLMPKYGFLSMALKPFLTGMVPDITIVPVNLSYDRVLEEVLFAYELLGIPKPKESTKGLVKALSILNENYGNIYVQFGDPFSVKQYFNDEIDRSVHGIGSVEMQDLTPNETACIARLAHSIVHRQKELTTITCFNLMAAVLNNHFLSQFEPPSLEYLTSEVQWFYETFKILAPGTSTLLLSSISEDMVLHQLNLHKSLLHISVDKKVQLCRVLSAQAKTTSLQWKGHKLSSATMDTAIPVLMLQFYVNPCAAVLIGVCFIALIAESLSKVNFISEDELLKEFQFLCSIFSFEFVFRQDFVYEDFKKALNHSKYFRIIRSTEGNFIQSGDNKKLGTFCVNFLRSYIPSYVTLMEVLLESAGGVFYEEEGIKECQKRLEIKLKEGSIVHFANLSLDLLTNALQALSAMKIISKEKGNGGFKYQVSQKDLQKTYSKLKGFYFSEDSKANFSQQFSKVIRASL